MLASTAKRIRNSKTFSSMFGLPLGFVVAVLVEDGFVEFRCGVVDFFRAERGKDDAHEPVRQPRAVHMRGRVDGLCVLHGGHG